MIAKVNLICETMKFLAAIVFAVLLLTNAPLEGAAGSVHRPPPRPAEAPPEPLGPGRSLVFDPLHAKSIDIGTFYLKKAILMRRLTASSMRRVFSRAGDPHKLLGETYEEEARQQRDAIDSYKKYLNYSPAER
jgi:hypothetical protein